MSLSQILRYLTLATLAAANASAVTLTPEQQAKLNALPPELRAQAMAEIRKVSQNSLPSSSQTPIEQPTVVTPKPAQAATDARAEAEFEASTDLASLGDPSETKTTRQDLKQYGYDLFAGSPTTFAPATDIPIPVDYIVGPGDQVRIQYFGKQSAAYDIYVTREGVLQIPDLGPLSVAGQTFVEMKNEIARRVADQMIGVQAFVTMGELRSIRIFVLGDVNRPGSYAVSSLTTMVNALFVSGGIRPIGSLRNVQLKRAGQTVATLDLYDLLLRGDTSKDARLMPGDVLFVPPVGPLVGIAGEVKRPAIYETIGTETFADIVAMAGGYTAQAFPALSQIERLNSLGTKEILDRDLGQPSMANALAQNGDTLRIYSTLDRVDNFVRLEGAVERPGDYQWAQGLHVLDLIPNREQLLLDADLDYALIVSRDPQTGSYFTRSFSFGDLFSGDALPPNLNVKDRIIVFRDTEGERAALDPIIARLRSQSISSDPEKIVSITGRVRHPGDYPLDLDMTIAALLRAAGGYTQDAYTLEAELIRFVDNDKTQRESILLPIDLRSIANSPVANLKLLPFDQILIKRIPDWNDRQTVTLEGEVRFPGDYTIERGETLSSVIERAGGLTDLAHPSAAVFMRETLRKAEAQQIARLRERLRDDVAAVRLQQDEVEVEGLRAAEGLLAQIENTEATGRLIIDFPAALANPSSDHDIILDAGDRLVVPQRPQSVTIIGSVNYPTSHLHQSGLTRDDYINLSGGMLKNADKSRIYVVKANGQVIADSRSRFFPRGGVLVEAGDTIVVPLDVDRMRPLKLWSEISQIVYQIALGAAAVNSF